MLGTRQRFYPAPNWQVAALRRRPGAGCGKPAPDATVGGCRTRALPRLGHVLVGLEVDLLVLETAPEPFDEDVIGKAAAAVHADGNPMGAQHAGEVVVGELAALVGVEDLGLPLAQCVLQ